MKEGRGKERNNQNKRAQPKQGNRLQSGVSPLAYSFPEQGLFVSGLRGQIDFLSHSNIPVFERQKLVAQISSSQGNLYLKRVIDSVKHQSNRDLMKPLLQRQAIDDSPEQAVASINQQEHERLIRQILRIAGPSNLRALYGMNTNQQVLEHLRTSFVSQASSLEEIRGEVLSANNLRGTQKGQLLRHLKKMAVSDLEQQIHATARVTVAVSTLIELPIAELGRLHHLIRANEAREIVRRVSTYLQAQEFMRRASNVTEENFQRERRRIATERGIGTLGHMRATQRLSYFQNSELVVHVIGAANAYGIDPYFLLGVFFQEGGRIALRRRRIHSLEHYGLDFAYDLRGERQRRPELQLGRLEVEQGRNENEEIVNSAWITGVRDVLYYTAVQAKKFQEKVIGDFSKAGLGRPQGDTLIVWLLIYWNGGSGKSTMSAQQCRSLSRKKNSGGWCRLLLAKERGDVETVLENSRRASRRPYSYANRVMGSIAILRRLIPF